MEVTTMDVKSYMYPYYPGQVYPKYSCRHVIVRPRVHGGVVMLVSNSRVGYKAYSPKVGYFTKRRQLYLETDGPEYET